MLDICRVTVELDACFLFQIGVLTGVSLATILGLSFGSLAPLFTKDPKVLGIVGTGVLVCMNILFFSPLCFLDDVGSATFFFGLIILF